ncbi:MAG: SAM-dependent DNA methyltransferase, partial [Planctomycetaceae bacterium]|nr:SAM-dependent DNA methyltransferase [Planctomycetaceae bacterium]
MISQLLGYTGSDHFISPERFESLPASELVYALRAAKRTCDVISNTDVTVRLDGVYLLSDDNQATSVPVVYVISAESDAIARRVHQFVWNQNQVPFLILESPSTVRLYSGFSYNNEADAPLVSAARDSAEVLSRLEAFRAAAIDDGSTWKQWAHSVKPQDRVDESLLRDLATLDKRLQNIEGMSREASHGLIGRYVYLNYLRDRDILSDKKLSRWGIKPDQLFSKHATLKAFRRTNAELQSWLNGSVFSLAEDDLSAISADQLKLVARVFAGDSPVGMTDIQSALFSIYDFSHIPIETLSCVYEQFLHDSKETKGPTRGQTLGAYYTPLPLTDYVLSEMERKKPLEPGMKVLDPSCGSGAFLVQSYRRLIERERQAAGRELKATELRDLLTSQIFGIDHDDDACRVAELSLILTLLDYIAPPDLENTNFKLPTLRNQNIFKGDFFDTAGTSFEFLAEQSFDWIVGNPPWTEVKGTPASEHEHYVAHQWMRANGKSHPTSGNQIAEAFLWKAGDHLATDGICGLVVLAMTWFKKESTTFRQRFFSKRRVWCLANFANMAYVLFSGSERPASVVFFENTEPDDDHTILTFAPFVAEQIANRPEKASKRLQTWNIVVGADALREIRQDDATTGDSLTWKLAMWGTSRDRKLLEKLDSRFKGQSLLDLGHLGIGEPAQGLELRTSESREELEHHPELIGKKRLLIDKLRGAGRIFEFPDNAIGEITAEECYVRKRGGLSGLRVSEPPHVIVDASRRFAVFSNEFIAVPPRQVGIAGSQDSERYLKALSLFLSSDFGTYHQFLI